MDKFNCSEIEENKNNPKLAVNITARDQERYYAPEVLHTDTFDRLANGKWCDFSSWPDFCVFQCLTRRDSLANFRAQKARENLERERVLRTELGRALEK